MLSQIQKNKLLLFLAILSNLVCLSSKVWGTSIIIRDNRLAHKNLTTQIGFGYNPLANRTAGFCFNSIEIIESSSSLKFTIKQIDLNWIREPVRRSDTQMILTKDFLRRQTDQNEHVNRVLITIDSPKLAKQLHFAHSKISPLLENLLNEGRITEAILSCGTHFFSGLKRYSSFLVLLEYDPLDQESDLEFFIQLRTALTRIYSGPEDSKLEKKARARRLRFVSEALGFAQHSHPPDIGNAESIMALRKNLRDVERFMQVKDTGLLTITTASSWNNYLPFLSAMQDPPRSLREIKNLETNSNFISTVGETLEKNENLVQYATLCSRNLYNNYPTLEEDPLGYDPDTTMFIDVLNPTDTSRYISLQSMRDHLSVDFIHNLERQRDLYLRGDRGDRGALACFENIESGDINEKTYDTYNTCIEIMRQAPIKSLFLKHYCQPVLAGTF